MGARGWARLRPASRASPRLLVRYRSFCTTGARSCCCFVVGYDFVQVKDKFIFGAIMLLAAKLTRTPFVYWLAFPFPEAWLDEARSPVARHPWVSWLRGHTARLLLYKVILPRADLVFVQSTGMRASIATKGVPAELMVPVPMGVSAQLLESRDGPRAPEVASPSVLYLGFDGSRASLGDHRPRFPQRGRCRTDRVAVLRGRREPSRHRLSA